MQALGPYSEQAPERSEMDATQGPLVLEFGATWCGICRGALPIITEAMQRTALRHIRIEDGKGKRLGRSYGVKLWPTLIMLRDGKEVARVVRPDSVEEIDDALMQLQT